MNLIKNLPEKYLLASIPLALALHVLATIPPILLGRFVDNSVSDLFDWKLISALIGLAVGIFIVEIGLNFFLASISQEIISKSYLSGMRRLMQKERLLFDKTKIGEMIDVFSRYVGSLENITIATISGLFPAVLGSIAIIAAIIYIVGLMSTLLIVMIHLIIFLISYSLSRKYGNRLKLYTRTCYELSDIWVELLGANKTIQNEYAFEFLDSRLSKSVSKMTFAMVSKTRWEGLSKSFIAFSQLISAMLVTLFLLGLRSDQVTFGSILSVLTLNGMLHINTRSISEFLLTFKSFSTYKDDFLKIDKSREYLHPGESINADSLEIAPVDVVKDNTLILKLDAPLRFSDREKVAVIGLSGAGKSTLISLFNHSQAQFQPYIILNGKKADTIDSGDYQRQVRIAFQESEILSGSGYLSWFLRDFPEKSEALLRQLKMPEDIIDGTRHLEPYGANISGGEAKRLNVARLLMMPGVVNILDEPTTGLNPSTTLRVWDIIFKELEDKIVICATHDLENLYRFDRVLLIDDGRVLADCPPATLLENPNFLKVKDRL